MTYIAKIVLNTKQLIEILIFTYGLYISSYVTIPEKFYFFSWTVSAQWPELGKRLWPVNGERTQSANGKKRERKLKWTVIAQCERYVNAMWTQVEGFIWSASGVILTLSFVGNQKNVKLTTSITCYQSRYNIIWTISKRWSNHERFVNGESEQSGWESASERTFNALWAHSERTVRARRTDGKMGKWTFQGL